MDLGFFGGGPRVSISESLSSCSSMEERRALFEVGALDFEDDAVAFEDNVVDFEDVFGLFEGGAGAGFA